jgi:hypothetical protein
MNLFRHKFRLAVCLVLALPVLYLAEEHARGRWLLARWKSAMVMKGEMFLIDECLPPTEAGENGFASLSRIAAVQPSQDLGRLLPPTMRFTGPGRMISILTISNWPPGSASAAGGDKSNVTWAQLEEELAQWTNLLTEARMALEAPVFDGRLDYHAGFSLPLPHLARFKGLAQRFSAAAASAVHRGQRDDAVANLEAILALNRAIESERLFISQLVRQAIAGIAFGTTWQAMQYPAWSDTDLARIQHAWQTQEFLSACGHALEMERAMAIDTYRIMRRSVGEAANVLGMWGGGFSGAPAPKPVQSLSDLADYLVDNSGELMQKGIYLPVWQIAWSHLDELNYLETTQPLIAAARASAEKKSSGPARVAEKQLGERSREESIAAQWRFPLSSQIAGVLDRPLTKAISAEVQRELVVAAIALERYQLKHGRPAADLNTLVPEFLPELPRDYWSDEPLGYRLIDGERFLLYSVGRDGHDDGGDPTPSGGSGERFSLIGGRDVVWPEPSTPDEAASALEPTSSRRTPPPRRKP